MVLALQVAFNEIRQQMFEDVGSVLQPALKRRHDERSHVPAVTHGKGALQLQCPDERKQENLVVHQLSKLLQGFLHAGLAASRHLGAQQETVTQTDIKEIKTKDQSLLWKMRKENISIVRQHAGVQVFGNFPPAAFFFSFRRKEDPHYLAGHVACLRFQFKNQTSQAEIKEALWNGNYEYYLKIVATIKTARFLQTSLIGQTTTATWSQTSVSHFVSEKQKSLILKNLKSVLLLHNAL